jgi:hypothetical protein
VRADLPWVDFHWGSLFRLHEIHQSYPVKIDSG